MIGSDREHNGLYVSSFELAIAFQSSVNAEDIKTWQCHLRHLSFNSLSLRSLFSVLRIRSIDNGFEL